MNLCDSNVLLALALSKHGHHTVAREWLGPSRRTLLKDDRIAFRADEPPGLESLWKELAARGTVSPKLWMDAYLAAFALAGRHRMVTTDSAFRQFRGLDLVVLEEHRA